PSIIYGMLGLSIFVRGMETITSGAFFGYADAATANGRTLLSAGLTLGLLILPLIIINSQEAIKAVPSTIKQASVGLGATTWQTIWHHVLPSALPGILTGAILSISRAIGETAPLVVVGASTFIKIDPDSIFSKFTTLPIQIYQWTARPQEEFRSIAAAAIIVLLIMLLSMNAVAVILRNRASQHG
ncbi:MAG: ABC transporter permease subunit, partial [Chloroflexota bacterium]